MKVSLLTRVWVPFHVLAVALWLLPMGSAVSQAVRPAVRPYISATGFYQYWSMFAPNPADQEVYLQVHLDYTPTMQRDWCFPIMQNVPLSDRYRLERWRKLIENVNQYGMRADWWYLASYANKVTLHIFPCHVTLVKHYRAVPPMLSAGQVASPDAGEWKDVVVWSGVLRSERDEWQGAPNDIGY